MLFKDPETTSIILNLGLRGNSAIISLSYYYKYLNRVELIYTSIQKPTFMPQIKTEDHSYQLSITRECKFNCSLLLEMAKLNAEFNTLLMISHRMKESFSYGTPQFLFQNPFTAEVCLCENLLPLFIQCHKHQTLSTSICPLANLAPPT